MSIRIIRGDCRDVLETLLAESVHCVVTSPPYWGLRDYGIPPTIWGGDAGCEHSWGEGIKSRDHGNGNGRDSSTLTGGLSTYDSMDKHARTATTFCRRCGAWYGVFGLEPTYQLYVEHAVEVFRAVWRVLRKDGTLWLNLGDSYATGAGKVGGCPGGGEQGSRWNKHIMPQTPDGKNPFAAVPTYQPNRMPQPGLKPKDLCGIPWRVAFALQENGWWLRQDIIWSKPNPMPESVTDRCTKAHEYLFLLTKSASYFYDAEAIKQPAINGGLIVNYDGTQKNCSSCDGINDRRTLISRPVTVSAFRNRRSVWEIATSPFSEAHFATFPPALIEPCILAGSPSGGTVIDPFGGAGTTGLVADRLQRNAILIELNPDYAALAERRVFNDAPLFSEVNVMTDSHR